jgi:DNA-binding MarR family transcriptional regulator
MQLSKCDQFSSQKEFARSLGISPAAMTTALSKLEDCGYIVRKTGKDSRFNEIYITDEGRRIVENSKLQFALVDKVMFSGLSDEDINIYSKCLEKMKDNLIALLDRGEA